MSCTQLAKTTSVAGQKIQIVEYQTASASAGPKYCAVTGHINTYIGFGILLPVSTWRQRYLQIGCGGLCGSISIAPPETTGYKPLADGDFVLAAEADIVLNAAIKACDPKVGIILDNQACQRGSTSTRS